MRIISYYASAMTCLILAGSILWWNSNNFFYYQKTGCQIENPNTPFVIRHCSAPAAEIVLIINSAIGVSLALILFAIARVTISLAAPPGRTDENKNSNSLGSLDPSDRMANVIIRVIWISAILYFLGQGWLNIDYYLVSGCQTAWKHSYPYCDPPMPLIIVCIKTLIHFSIALTIGIVGWLGNAKKDRSKPIIRN